MTDDKDLFTQMPGLSGAIDDDVEEPVELVEFDFDLDPGGDRSRREFLQILGAGLLIAVTADAAIAQVPPRGRRGGGGTSGRNPVTLAARLHIGKDGRITVMTGKVECGQGARAELTQAAAEELRVNVDRVHLVMAVRRSCPTEGLRAAARRPQRPGDSPGLRGARPAHGRGGGEWNVDAGTRGA